MLGSQTARRFLHRIRCWVIAFVVAAAMVQISPVAKAGVVTVTKSTVNTPWRVGQLTTVSGTTTANAFYSILVTNVGTASGSAAAPVTITDVLPRGLWPGWTGTRTTGGFNCTWVYSAGAGRYTVTCVFAARTMGANSSATISLPVWVDQLATGLISNTSTSTPGTSSSNATTTVNGVAWIDSNDTCPALTGVLGPNSFANNGSFGSLGTNTVGSSTQPTNSGGPIVSGATTLTYRAPNLRLNDGEYRLANRLSSQLTSRDYEWFWTVGDRTTLGANGGKGDPNGLMMVINAAIDPDVFYEETLTVTPYTNYEFSLWAIHANNPNSSYWTLVGAPRPFNLLFAVNRIGIDDDGDGLIDEPGEMQTLVSSGDVAATATPTWRQYAALFNSGAATQVAFIFRNNGLGGNGNDLGIDDLMLATCSNLPSANVSGALYFDDNGNNVLDGSEPGRLPANISVDLVNSKGVVVALSETDANGQYVFRNIPVVPDANYTVRVSTTDSDIPAGAVLGTPNPVAVTLSASTTATVNFGYDRSRLMLRKTWANAVIGDQAVLTVARAGTDIGSLLSVADTANETDASAVLITVLPGETLLVSEALTGTGAYNNLPSALPGMSTGRR